MNDTLIVGTRVFMRQAGRLICGRFGRPAVPDRDKPDFDAVRCFDMSRTRAVSGGF